MFCDIWLCGGIVAWRWDLRGRSCTKHCVCRVSVRWWLVKGRVRHTAVVDIHGLSSMELLRQSAFTIPLSVGGFCSSWYAMELLWVASVRRRCILVISLFLFAIQLWHQWRIWIFAQSCAEVGDCAGIDWNCVKHLKRSEKRYKYISFYLSWLWFSRSSGFTPRGHWCDPGSSVPIMTARCHKTSLWQTWYDLSVFQFWDETG